MAPVEHRKDACVNDAQGEMNSRSLASHMPRSQLAAPPLNCRSRQPAAALGIYSAGMLQGEHFDADAQAAERRMTEKRTQAADGAFGAGRKTAGRAASFSRQRARPSNLRAGLLCLQAHPPRQRACSLWLRACLSRLRGPHSRARATLPLTLAPAKLKRAPRRRRFAIAAVVMLAAFAQTGCIAQRIFEMMAFAPAARLSADADPCARYARAGRSCPPMREVFFPSLDPQVTLQGLFVQHRAPTRESTAAAAPVAVAQELARRDPQGRAARGGDDSSASHAGDDGLAPRALPDGLPGQAGGAPADAPLANPPPASPPAGLPAGPRRAAAGDDRLIVYFHGNGGHIYGRIPQLLVMSEIANVFIFSYRGYGKSAGEPTEAGVYQDARAALRYARDTLGFAPAQTVLYGRSLGAAVAVEVARDRAHAALILISPFLSGRAMADHRGLGWVPGLGRPFDSAGKLDALALPVLIVHGTHDWIVPFEQGRALYDLYSGRKDFKAVAGAGHNDLAAVAGDAYWAWIAQAALGVSR